MGKNGRGRGRSAMKVYRIAWVCVVIVLLAPAHEPLTAAPASCASLAALRLTNAEVTSATDVAAGAFTPPAAGGRGVPPATARAMAAAPAFCRVAVTSRPTKDSDIK